MSAKIVDNLVLSAEKSQQKSLSIANPTLRTEVGTTAYINLSEEILNWEQKELKTQLIDFSTELTPLNLTSKGEIESEVRFSVNSGTDFSTTVRLAAGETKLIGFLKLKENKVNDESKTNKKSNKESKDSFLVKIKNNFWFITTVVLAIVCFYLLLSGPLGITGAVVMNINKTNSSGINENISNKKIP